MPARLFGANPVLVAWEPWPRLRPCPRAAACAPHFHHPPPQCVAMCRCMDLRTPLFFAWIGLGVALAIAGISLAALLQAAWLYWGCTLLGRHTKGQPLDVEGRSAAAGATVGRCRQALLSVLALLDQPMCHMFWILLVLYPPVSELIPGVKGSGFRVQGRCGGRVRMDEGRGVHAGQLWQACCWFFWGPPRPGVGPAGSSQLPGRLGPRPCCWATEGTSFGLWISLAGRLPDASECC